MLTMLAVSAPTIPSRRRGPNSTLCQCCLNFSIDAERSLLLATRNNGIPFIWMSNLKSERSNGLSGEC